MWESRSAKKCTEGLNSVTWSLVVKRRLTVRGSKCEILTSQSGLDIVWDMISYPVDAKTYPNMSALTDSGALMKILVCPSWYWSWSMFTERRRCSTPCFSSPRHVGHDSFVRIAYLRQRKREKMRKLSPFGEWNHIWLKHIFFIHIKVQNAQLSLLKWSPV